MLENPMMKFLDHDAGEKETKGSGSHENEEAKKNKIEAILQEIESNRFKTMCDPGISGIKSRLSKLEFIKDTGTSCCSGHPKDGHDEDGYVFLTYKSGETQALDFHNKLLATSYENDDLIIKITSDMDTEERMKRERPFDYRIEVEPKSEEHKHYVNNGLNPYEIAEGLKSLWTKVSEVMNEYEDVPIPEKLEDWYFAFSSQYGRMENTGIFTDFEEEVIKRGGSFDEKKEEDDDDDFSAENEFSGIDLRAIDNGRLIFPSKAEGVTAHYLNIENINLPVSFTVLDSGHFRENGLLEGSDKGVVVSGIVSNELAKINHVNVDEELRAYAKEHGNVRIGEALIADLEQNLGNTGIKEVYAVFYNPETVAFFLRNGYEVLPVQSLTEEQKNGMGIDEEGFDERISDGESFLKLREADDQDIKHILLKKQLIQNTTGM